MSAARRNGTCDTGSPVRVSTIPVPSDRRRPIACISMCTSASRDGPRTTPSTRPPATSANARRAADANWWPAVMPATCSREWVPEPVSPGSDFGAARKAVAMVDSTRSGIWARSPPLRYVHPSDKDE